MILAVELHRLMPKYTLEQLLAQCDPNAPRRPDPWSTPDTDEPDVDGPNPGLERLMAVKDPWDKGVSEHDHGHRRTRGDRDIRRRRGSIPGRVREPARGLLRPGHGDAAARRRDVTARVPAGMRTPRS
jgi:hypothetical protein